MTILMNKKWGGITPLKKGGKHWFKSCLHDSKQRGSEVV